MKIRKILLFVVSILSLTGVLIAIFVTNREISEVRGWYNSSWAYRVPLILLNENPQENNADYLYSVDTASLISQGKLQTDCGDLRFVDSDDSTSLSYWIESGCNTSNTQIWIRIPVLPSGETTIYSYYGNSSATNGTLSWSGQFYLLSNQSSCGTGWTRDSSFDGRYLRGSASFGTTLGSTHSHGYSLDSGAATPLYLNSGQPWEPCEGSGIPDHIHIMEGTTQLVQIEPPYYSLLVCSSNELRITDKIAMFGGGTTPSNWMKFDSLNNRFPIGSDTAGLTGGSETHNHQITSITVYQADTQAELVEFECDANYDYPINSDAEHTHTVSYTSITESSSLPEYTDMYFAESTENDQVGTEMMIAGVNSLPPLGWYQYASLNNRFARGAASVEAVGNNGGTAIHSHSMSIELAPSTEVLGSRGIDSINIGYSSSTHMHDLANTTSWGGQTIPLSKNIIYAQRLPSQSITLGAEEEYNSLPSAPSDLRTEGSSSSYVVGVTDTTPEFSAVYQDFDSGDTATYYQIQVNVDQTFVQDPTWDSGQVAMSPLAVGERIPDKSYAGTPLALDGTVYYWRIKFWDDKGGEGAWASPFGFKMDTAPNQPSSPLVEGEFSPTKVMDTTPEFSAIYSDQDFDEGTFYQIEVNTNNTFTGTVLWDSGQSPLTPIPSGERSEDISYNGTPLSFDGSTYYWRIRFWDPYGLVTEWLTGGSFTMNTAPNAPTLLLTEGQVNPTMITDLTPEFSAVFSDPDGDSGTSYQIVVSTQDDLSSLSLPVPIMPEGLAWDSGQMNTTAIPDSSRSQDLGYNGSSHPLFMNGEHLYWVIRFWDNFGAPSPWSETAEFQMLNIPAGATDLTAEVLSPTEIRWHFTDNATGELGIHMYDLNYNLVKTCLGEDITYCDEDGLEENHGYTRIGLVFNDEAEGFATNEATGYTLLSVPTIQYGGTKTDTTISLTSSVPANNGELYFDCEGDCDTNLNVWTLANTVNASNLLNNTSYTFKVKARNIENVETAYSNSISLYTAAPVPSITVGPLSTTSISLSASGINNLSTGDSGVFFDCTNDDCQAGIREWIKSGSDVAINLQPNTEYSFIAKARNYDGEETAYSADSSVYTLAQQPTMLSATALSNTQIAITASNSTNPANTELLIQEETTGKYLNTSTGELQALPYWGTSTTTTVINLSTGTEYSFKVKARNGDLVETSFSSTLSITTFLSPISALQPTVNSNTQITWNISQAVDNILGIKVFDVQGNLVKTCIGNDILSCSETSLTPNTSYSRKLKVYNNSSESAFTNVVSASTFASIPTILNLEANDYTSNSVNLTINPNSNPESTKYLLQEKNTGKYLNPLLGIVQSDQYYFTYEQMGRENGKDVEGLLPNTTYTFRSLAQNSDEINTAYGNEVTITTQAQVPTILSVSATGSGSIRVVTSRQENSSSTLLNLIETKSSKSVNPVTKLLDSNTIWKTEQEYGASSGTEVTGLQTNTQYSFCVKAKNSVNIETNCSQIVSKYTLTNTAKLSTRVSSSSSMEITVDKNSNPSNTKYQILETVTNGYVSDESKLTSTPVLHNDSRVSSNFSFTNLPPNTTYKFKVRTINTENVTSSWSDIFSATTWANIPKDFTFETIGGDAGKIRFDSNGNPSSTRYAIQEENSGKYLDPLTMKLISGTVWGTYSTWGGDKGLTFKSLDPGSEYSFIIKAMNDANVETSFVESNTGKTYSIIINKPESVNTLLVENSSVDVSNVDGAQTGVQEIRVLDNEYIVADIPISFDSNRDWSDAIVKSSPEESKAVIKLNQTHGLTDRFTMYVVKNETDDVFRICPEARSLEEVHPNCPNGVLFNGPYPQKLKVESADITVSQATISKVTYWIADGLSGTGGEGETFGEGPTTSNDSESPMTNNGVKFIQDTLNLLDKTPIGNIKKESLPVVAVTTAALTLSSVLSTILSSIGQIGYTSSQVILNILGILGFRRKRYPLGFVYNSVTREPIEQAVIRIYDLSNKLLETTVSNTSGLFSVSIPTGEYIITVKKNDYDFPSKLLLGREDYPLSNLYHGERTNISEEHVDLVIPMDPKEEQKRLRIFLILKSIFSNTLPILNIFLFILGIIITAYVYSKVPDLKNLLISFLYIPTLLALIKSLKRYRRHVGKVTFQDGGIATNVTLLLKEKDFGKVVAKRVTNEKGNYYFNISEEGEFTIEIEPKYQIVNGNTEIKSTGKKMITEDLVITK